MYFLSGQKDNSNLEGTYGTNAETLMSLSSTE